MITGLHYRLGLGLLLSFSLIATRVWATTVAPTGPAPDGSVAVPLTTSSAAQTKAGKLQVLGPSTVQGPLTVGKNSGTSNVCWNNDCRTGWDDVLRISGYLHLQSNTASPDVGRAVIQGSSLPADPISAIHAVAGTAQVSFPTFGVYGTGNVNVAAGQTTAKSTGVLGQASVNSSLHSGIYATAKPGGVDYTNAWAGYFFGSVGVGNTTEAGTYDLVVGSGSAVNNGIAELCLGGVCNSVWPVGSGTGLWTLATSGAINYYKTNTNTRSLNIGGSGAAASFAVAVTSAGGVPTGASLTVDGPAKYEKYVVGAPSNLTIGQTCGDGVCNNGENDTFGSGNYCAQDCDVTAPPDVSIFDNEDVQPCQFGHPCPRFSPTIHLRWFNSPTPDVAGARLIIRTDRFPVGAKDTDFIGSGPQISGGNIGGAPGSTISLSPNCQLASQGGPTYYIGLYQYDGAGNFAPGAYWIPNCTDIIPPSP